jgi:hypothetical protein
MNESSSKDICIHGIMALVLLLLSYTHMHLEHASYPAVKSCIAVYDHQNIASDCLPSSLIITPTLPLDTSCMRPLYVNLMHL